jgi:hypothetical protein
MTDIARDRVARAGLWAARTATSPAKLYYETRHARTPPELTRVPTSVAVFPRGSGHPSLPRMDAQHRARSDFETGGHLAAMETPTLLVNDIPKFFSTLT